MTTYNGFELLNAELLPEDGEYGYDGKRPDAITATLKTEQGEVDLYEWYEGNSAERTDSNIDVNLRKEVNALFPDDTPWDGIYNALDNEITLLKKQADHDQPS